MDDPEDGSGETTGPTVPVEYRPPRAFGRPLESAQPGSVQPGSVQPGSAQPGSAQPDAPAPTPPTAPTPPPSWAVPVGTLPAPGSASTGPGWSVPPAAPSTGPGWTLPPPPPQPEVLQVGTPGSPGGGRGRVVAMVVGLVAVVLVLVAGGVYAAGHALRGRTGPAGQAALPTAPDGQDPFGNPFGPAPGPPAPTPSAPVIPSQGWTVPVNAYCRDVDLQLKAVPSATTVAGQISSLRQLAGIIRTMNTRLRGMQVPADSRSAFEAMMAAWEQVPAGYEQAAVAAEKADRDGYAAAIAHAEQANDQGNVIAGQLGLGYCADAGGLPETVSSPKASTI
ncbi:MAG TPA: hypothetical protein VI248_16360 [Kineosporiaceae bacterium]